MAVRGFLTVGTLLTVICNGLYAATPSHDSKYLDSLPKGATTSTVTARGFYAFWCTDFAAFRIQQKGVPFYNQWPTGSGRWGNAAEWEKRASEIGMYTLASGSKAYGKNGVVLRTSSQPGDTAVWRVTSKNPQGHVARSLNAGTLPRVEEYNWVPAFEYATRETNISSYKPSAFVGINPPANASALWVVADSTSLTVKAGKQIETRLKVTNNGNAPLTITATVQEGATNVLGRTNNLNNTTLAVRGTGSIGVLFRPTKKGNFSTLFTIVSDGGMRAVTIKGVAN